MTWTDSSPRAGHGMMVGSRDPAAGLPLVAEPRLECAAEDSDSLTQPLLLARTFGEPTPTTHSQIPAAIMAAQRQFVPRIT